MLAYALVSHSFDVAAVVLGGLLIAGALLSELVNRSFVSLAAVFVVAGFILGNGGIGVLDFTRDSGFVADLATVALIVILLRDGLEVDGDMVRSNWHLPARKLIAAMPLTALVVALATKLLIGLSWTEAFLVGALLSPTDPVLSSNVVTNPRVPAIVRGSLNLESGLNDGLALPAVLALAASLAPTGHFVVWQFICENLGFGFGIGLVVGLIASLTPTGRLAPHQQALVALGIAFWPTAPRSCCPTATG